MVGYELYIAVGGGLAGLISIILNIINSRRMYIAAMRPQVNVDLIANKTTNNIECSMEIANVGQKELFLRSIRIYGYDVGFNANIQFGVSIYSTNAIIHDQKIINKVYSYEQPFTYDNLVEYCSLVLKMDKEKVKQDISQDFFRELETFIRDLSALDSSITFPLAVLIRPFFFFRSNYEFMMKLKKLPIRELPNPLQVVEFDLDAYQGSSFKRNINSAANAPYLVLWEKNSCWELRANPTLDDLISNFNWNEILYTPEQDIPDLSLSPSELGFPEILYPNENRFFKFTLPYLNEGTYELKATLYLTMLKPKYFILTEEQSSAFSFFAKNAS